MKNSWLSAFFASVVSLVFCVTPVDAQVLTVQVGSAAPPPTPLVNHGDNWRYRKGTNEPQANWKIASDATLDATWLTGPGGFGFADSDDATVLNDMLNGYNTVYIRRTFTVPTDVDAGRRVMLTMDWDDGFVAYLDGGEIARSSNVIVTNPIFSTQTAPNQNHEASAGENGNPPTTYDLGPVSSVLTPGTHVLAVHGLNAATNSSDFSLIADLALTGGSQTPGGGKLFAIVKTSTVALSGTNTIPGSMRVTVNGEPTLFNPTTGEWSRQHALSFGLNRLFIAATDESGAILASTNRHVLYEPSSVTVGGRLTEGTSLASTTQVYRVTSNLIVSPGVTLNVGNGAVVLLSAGVSIIAETNSTLNLWGSLFAPADGDTSFGDLSARGTNAALTVSGSEVIGGQVRALNGGETVVWDSTIRDLPETREIVAAVGAKKIALYNSHISGFSEIDSRDGEVLIDGCLIEQFMVDGVDVKTTNGAPLVVRNTTLRSGDPSNTNADALDFGPGAGLVENCLIHDFPDKGVSIGGAPGTVVRNSLIYRCGIGVSAYASDNLAVYSSTISQCSVGVLFRNNPTPAFGVATNLIVWGNLDNVTVTNTSSLNISFSDIQGAAAWPGTGNINADPLFVDPLNDDFRLAPGSPALSGSSHGGEMGVYGEVSNPGGIPSAPANLAALPGLRAVTLQWQDTSDNEGGFRVYQSTNGLNWQDIRIVQPNTTSVVISDLPPDVQFYYVVAASNTFSMFKPSNIAKAAARDLTNSVGGVLAGNTTWSPDQGVFRVVSNVIVPSGVRLTVDAGTLVTLMSGTSIRAVNGGSIAINGTRENKVVLTPLVTNTLWAELSAQFGGSITVRHADISGGQTTVYTNAVGLFEDSYFHHYRQPSGSIFTLPLMLTHYAAPTTVRRCHFREYHETLFRNGIVTIEDSLFENIHGDGLDFDGALPGTVLRRCTFRHGVSGNVDAIDVGNDGSNGSTNVIIEDSVMFDFPFDKGVSVGDLNTARGIVVRNCLIYNCLSGVMAKDNCDVSVYQCTIANNNWGFTNYNKGNTSSPTGGGITTNTHNNILWNNGITISMVNGSALFADHNDFGGTNWPGQGNINVDPLFVNVAQRDYRLAPNSPVRGAGRNGTDMGAHFPIGSPLALSHPRIEAFSVSAASAIVSFWADSEKSYSLLSSDSVTGTWTRLLNVPTRNLPQFISFTNTVAPGNRFYQLVTPALP